MARQIRNEDGRIVVWGLRCRKKRLGSGFGEKENWALEGIGQWVNHAWHTHPVGSIAFLLDVWKIYFSQHGLNVFKKYIDFIESSVFHNVLIKFFLDAGKFVLTSSKTVRGSSKSTMAI